jgi:predicted dehydrogenase
VKNYALAWWGWAVLRKKPGCRFGGGDGLDAARGMVAHARKGRAYLRNLAHSVCGSLQDLARECDAVFVHTSTATHYQVVSELLNAGVHVCVDKPLAENVQDAERLIELAARKN